MGRFDRDAASPSSLTLAADGGADRTSTAVARADAAARMARPRRIRGATSCAAAATWRGTRCCRPARLDVLRLIVGSTGNGPLFAGPTSQLRLLSTPSAPDGSDGVGAVQPRPAASSRR
jgi:hypothetical protein